MTQAHFSFRTSREPGCLTTTTSPHNQQLASRGCRVLEVPSLLPRSPRQGNAVSAEKTVEEGRDQRARLALVVEFVRAESVHLVAGEGEVTAGCHRAGVLVAVREPAPLAVCGLTLACVVRLPVDLQHDAGTCRGK